MRRSILSWESLFLDCKNCNPYSNQPNGFHFNIDPKYGSVKVTAWDVTFSPNGYAPNSLVYHVYTTPGKQKDIDIVGNQSKALVPGSRWLLT